MANILALDLATTLGWAVGPAGVEGIATPLEVAGGKDQVRVFSGAHRIAQPGTDDGPFMSAYVNWLDDMIVAHEPKVIVYELPFVDSNKLQQTAFRLIGLSQMTEYVCYCRKVKAFSANNSSVRKHFIKKGSGKREVLKSMTIRMCRDLGFNPVDDNDADAIAVWHWAAHNLSKNLLKNLRV